MFSRKDRKNLVLLLSSKLSCRHPGDCLTRHPGVFSRKLFKIFSLVALFCYVMGHPITNSASWLSIRTNVGHSGGTYIFVIPTQSIVPLLEEKLKYES